MVDNNKKRHAGGILKYCCKEHAKIGKGKILSKRLFKKDKHILIKCPIIDCNVLVDNYINNYNKGVKKYCCREHLNIGKSNAQKRRYGDPIKREKHRLGCNTVNAKKNYSKSSTQTWGNSNYKKEMSIMRGGTGISGELSEYGVEFTKELKEFIRKRDEYTCQGEDCGITEIEHQMKYGINLCIHHLDYNKKNCSEVNLITLCHACNAKANFNRKYWEEYFTKLMISRINIENTK
jgi:DNA-directed RNA polymerase subunit N (RpoN/RPB10)